MIYPDTGSLASTFRYARSGIDARLGLANAAGGIHGRTITYEWADDESDLAVNAEAARLLVERDEVFGILMETGVAAGSAAYLDEIGVPVAGIAGEDVWSQHRNMFAFANLSATGPSVTTFGQFAVAQGGTRAVLVNVPASDVSRGIGDKLTESLASQGVEVVAQVVYDGTAGPDEVSRQIRNAGADVLVGALTADAFAQVYIAAQADGADLDVAR
nr:ABC transporter substrate-binding protein [Micromonospora sp. DSM 115978]